MSVPGQSLEAKTMAALQPLLPLLQEVLLASLRLLAALFHLETPGFGPPGHIPSLVILLEYLHMQEIFCRH
jgi:hypothetical protein